MALEPDVSGRFAPQLFFDIARIVLLATPERQGEAQDGLTG